MNTIVKECQVFFEQVYQHTTYEEYCNGRDVFDSIIESIPDVVFRNPEGLEVISKFQALSTSITGVAQFKNMVKVLWRFVKSKYAPAQHKLTLMNLGIITMVLCLKGKARTKDKVVEWCADIAKWQGIQLTIGGKGCTGEGEGDALQRMERFFQTPYLHDFD